MSQHLTDLGILYVVQLLPVDEEGYFLNEVGIIQVCQTQEANKIKAFLKAKNSCVLTTFVNQLVMQFSGGAFS